MLSAAISCPWNHRSSPHFFTKTYLTRSEVGQYEDLACEAFILSSYSYITLDHVYVAPPCDTRDCSPYVICRIISLPDGTKPSTTAPTFRVAYYLRRRDVTNRSLSDHRTIFATFSEGHVPAEHVRAKCQVLHRDYVIDEDTYKRQPDCFVFSQVSKPLQTSVARHLTTSPNPLQLYDRFMHKPFELIPTSQVANAPGQYSLFFHSPPCGFADCCVADFQRPSCATFRVHTSSCARS